MGSSSWRLQHFHCNHGDNNQLCHNGMIKIICVAESHINIWDWFSRLLKNNVIQILKQEKYFHRNGCEWPWISAGIELFALQFSKSNETNWFDWSSETIPSTSSPFALADDIETGFLSFLRDEIEKLLDSLVSKLSSLSSWTSNCTSRFAGLIKSLLKIQAKISVYLRFQNRQRLNQILRQRWLKNPCILLSYYFDNSLLLFALFCLLLFLSEYQFYQKESDSLQQNIEHMNPGQQYLNTLEKVDIQRKTKVSSFGQITLPVPVKLNSKNRTVNCLYCQHCPW